MKTSRICAAVVSTLALFAAGHASAEPAGAGATSGTVTLLNTFSKVWVNGDALGPVQNGVARIGKNTGAGIMDANFTFDKTAAAKAAYSTKVLLGSVYTRSSLTPNNNNSYMQGGFAVSELTETGVKELYTKDLPQLNGERAFMRPLIGFTPKYAVLIAASEDNGINNNPQPVMYIADKATGALVQITNNTRGANNLNKPTNLIQQALKDGIQVQNPNNQRGPHNIVPVSDNSFIVGMQYNNQAQEAFRVTVNDDGSVKMNWLKRYSNNAQHCRPQVAIAEGATEGYVAAVEADEQPAEIGFRLTKFNVATGQSIASKIVVRSNPQQNLYVAEPSIALVGDKVAIGYGFGTPVRNRNNNDANGHTGSSKQGRLALFSGADLSMVGEPMLDAAPYGRHAHIYSTSYGESGEKAIAYAGGSSTGTKGGLAQLIPLKADGTLGNLDYNKVYPMSLFSDVANVQARGKRNPNNQAKGFINGLGDVPNPGFDKGDKAFMPEVKTFTMSTITGYTDAKAMDIARRNSLWLSLIPSQWKTGLKTTPGTPTDKPGPNADGTGPAPTTTGTATDPSGDAKNPDKNVLEGTEATTPDGRGDYLGDAGGGCNVSSTSSSSSGGALIFLAVAGVIVALRRKSEEV